MGEGLSGPRKTSLKRAPRGRIRRGQGRRHHRSDLNSVDEAKAYPEATLTLIHPALDVKSWTEIEPDVEAARPSHCPRCGGAAHRDDGLRLHGHGLRERCIWGPPEVGAESMRANIFIELPASRGVPPRSLQPSSQLAAIRRIHTGTVTRTAAHVYAGQGEHVPTAASSARPSAR